MNEPQFNNLNLLKQCTNCGEILSELKIIYGFDIGFCEPDCESTLYYKECEKCRHIEYVSVVRSTWSASKLKDGLRRFKKKVNHMRENKNRVEIV